MSHAMAWDSQAYNAYCLEQMGVVSWLSVVPESPWQCERLQWPWPVSPAWQILDNTHHADTVVSATTLGQDLAISVLPQATNSADQLKHALRHTHDLIEEDLQPIAERAVDIDIAPVVEPELSSIQLQAYIFEAQLLVITQVPKQYGAAADLDNLALKMAQAILKQPIHQWQCQFFVWPGALVNPHFIKRQAWFLGALEGFLTDLLRQISGCKLVLAGEQLHALVAQLPLCENIEPVRIVSLPELYRIPELKRDAWRSLQVLVTP